MKIERLTSLEAFDKNYWANAQYSPQGVPKQIDLGNTLIERWAFNVIRQQPWQIKIGTASNESDRGRWEFNYCGGFNDGSCSSNNGNIVGQWNYEPNRIQSYSYDALNRLSAVSEGGTGSWSENYGYDRYSNLYWSARNGLGTPHLMKPDSTNWFTIGGINKNRAVPPGSSESSYYDNAGNMIQYGSLSLAYDAENRPRQALGSGTVNYYYDGEGRRVKKVVDSVATWFAYDASGNLAAEYGGATPAAAATHYITTDHRGSTRLVTNQSGAVVSRHDYLPFGEEIGAGIGGRTTAMMYDAVNALTQRFTGKERDAETGLDYFLARYLSPGQGRFASPDWSASPAPVPYADFANPQSLNLYTDGLNAPTRYNDPTGHCVWDACISETYVVVSAVTVAAAAAVAAVQSTPAGRKATDAIADGLSKAVANAQQGLANVISQNPAGTSLFGQHAYLSKSSQASGGQAQQGQANGEESASGQYDPDDKNVDRMKQGKPPTDKDGKPVELHHKDQDPRGPLQK